MIAARLKEYWLSQGLDINPGVSNEKLSAFESKYQVSLPGDLRDYFLAVNGMPQGVSDEALIRFWMLDELKPIPEGAPEYADPAYIQDAESLFLFADYCIWSHAFAIRLSSGSENSNPVLVIGDESPSKMFDSFSDLVSSYLNDPRNLLSNIRESDV